MPARQYPVMLLLEQHECLSHAAIVLYFSYMSSFAIFHPRLNDNLLFPQGAPIGHVARLFILDVPKGVSAQIIGEVLRKAGRDPALMDISVSSIAIASESNWPADVRNAST